MQGGGSVIQSRWIFGYKLRLVSNTGSLIVPLSADFTQADVQEDNQIYPAITSSSLPHRVQLRDILISDMMTIICII